MKTSTLLKRYIRLVVEGNENRHLYTTAQDIAESGLLDKTFHLSPTWREVRDMGNLSSNQAESISELEETAVALVAAGIALAPRGSGTSHLGRGSYGVVIDGVHLASGRRVAVKITEDAGEAEAYRKVQTLRASAGESAGVLPEILFISDNNRTRYYLIVMEVLQSLPRGIADVFDGGDTWKGPQPALAPTVGKSSPNIIHNAVEALREIFDEAGSLALTKVEKERLATARKIAIARAPTAFEMFLNPPVLGKTRSKIQITAEQFEEEFNKVVGSAIVSACIGLSQAEREDFEQLVHVARANVGFSLANEFSSGKFAVPFEVTTPSSNYERNRTRQEDQRVQATRSPQIQTFWRRVKDLNQKLGIDFHDMHVGNVMMRGSTRELVVADVGLFMFH
jgi:hypothetical protein